MFSYKTIYIALWGTQPNEFRFFIGIQMTTLYQLTVLRSFQFWDIYFGTVQILIMILILEVIASPSHILIFLCTLYRVTYDEAYFDECINEHDELACRGGGNLSWLRLVLLFGLRLTPPQHRHIGSHLTNYCSYLV